VTSTRFYILFAVVVTLALFGVLVAEPLGLFDFVRDGFSAAARVSASGTGDTATERPVPAPFAFDDKPRHSPRVAALFGSRGNDELAERVEELTEEKRALESANRILEERLTAVLNWILVNFRGKFPLPEAHMANVRLEPLTEDFLLSPDLAELFKIDAAEEEKINDAFAYAQDYLREVEAALITARTPRPGKVILHIPAFPQDGEYLKEDLYAALEATLGEHRFDRFIKVSEEGLKDTFYQFGGASRTMVFELAYAEDDPYPQLKVKDGYVIDLGPNERTITATESYVTNLPAKYSAYLTWLPEYVAAYATE